MEALVQLVWRQLRNVAQAVLSALNVKLMKFNQARVKGGSNFLTNKDRKACLVPF